MSYEEFLENVDFLFRDSSLLDERHFDDNFNDYVKRYISENYDNAAFESIARGNIPKGIKENRVFNLFPVDKDENGNISFENFKKAIEKGPRKVNLGIVDPIVDMNEEVSEGIERRQAERRKNNQPEVEQQQPEVEQQPEMEQQPKIEEQTEVEQQSEIEQRQPQTEPDPEQIPESASESVEEVVDERTTSTPKKNNMTQAEKVEQLNDDVKTLAKFEKEKKKLSEDTTLTAEEKLKKEQELKEKYSYDEVKTRIESTDKKSVKTYLDERQGISKKNKEYDDYLKSLDTAGSDYVDINGNEVGKANRFINKTFKKAELKTKGFFKGDYSEYNEYVDAVKKIESTGQGRLDRYDVDNLFDSGGSLNQAEDLLDLKPRRSTTKEIFDEWQDARRSSATAARSDAPKIDGAAISKENLLKSHPNAKKLFTAQGVFGLGMNLFNTVSTYKEERKEGKSVLGSFARAGLDFALGEVLGMKYMGIMAAQALPRMAVSGLESLGKLTREKNNMQRHEAFGYASFQDTQQLATMRQSGMEMAKMANYNLQQTLMGNEAKYMHR